GRLCPITLKSRPFAGLQLGNTTTEHDLMKSLPTCIGVALLGFSLFSTTAYAQREALLDAARTDRLMRQNGGVDVSLMSGYSSGYDSSYSRSRTQVQDYERRAESRGGSEAPEGSFKEAMRKMRESLPKNYGEKRDQPSTGITDGSWQERRLAKIRQRQPQPQTRSNYFDYNGYAGQERREKRGILESIGHTLGDVASNEEEYIAKRRAGLVNDEEFDPGKPFRALPSFAGNLANTAGQILPNGGGEAQGTSDRQYYQASERYAVQPGYTRRSDGVVIPDSIAQMANERQSQPTANPAAAGSNDGAAVQPLDEVSQTANYLGGGEEATSDPRVWTMGGVFGKKNRKNTQPAPGPDPAANTATNVPAEEGLQPALSNVPTEDGSIFTRQPMRGYTPPTVGFGSATPPPPAPESTVAAADPGIVDYTQPMESGLTDATPSYAETETTAEPEPTADEPAASTERKQINIGMPKIGIPSIPKVRIGRDKSNDQPAAADSGPSFGSRVANSVRGIGQSAPDHSTTANAEIVAGGGADPYVVKSRTTEFHPYHDYSVSSAGAQTLAMGSVVELTKAGKEWSAVRLPNGTEGIMRTKDLRKARLGEARSGRAIVSNPVSAPAIAPPPAPAAPPSITPPADSYLDPLPTASSAPAATSTRTSGGGAVNRSGNRISGSYYAAPETVPLPEVNGDGPGVELGQGILAPPPPPRSEPNTEGP
ncbi:MAG: hypothetical protein AAF585_24425, partial [Verrucomicrobiota bacterium]